MICDSLEDFMLMSDNELGKLITLEVSYENLKDSDLNEVFINKLNKCVNLEDLYLDHNPLTTLPENIFINLVNLNRLDLNSIQFKTFPENIFDSLTNLKELRLYNNQLTALPDNIFDKLVNLETLSLCNNQLTALPDNIYDKLVNLRYLNSYGIRLNKNMLKIGCQEHTLDYWIDNLNNIAYEHDVTNQSDILIYKIFINKCYNQYKNSIK